MSYHSTENATVTSHDSATTLSTVMLISNSSTDAYLVSTASTNLHNSTILLSTVSNSEAPNEPGYDRDIIRYAGFYLKAFIIFPGIILNILSLLVFALSRMRKSTSGQYLMALTLFDTLVLTGELLQWLNDVVGETFKPILGINFRDTNNFACQFILFLRYFGRLSSAWVTIIITGERFITVTFPLKVARISTNKIANIIIVSVTVIGAGLSSFPFYTTDAKTRGFCGITNKHLYNIFMWIVVYIGDLIVPSILVCILTGLIVVTLFKANAMRRRQAAGQNIKTDKEFQLNVTLIFIAVAFVVLRLPYCIAYFLHINRYIIFNVVDKYTDYVLWATRDLTAAIAISNYMVNFFLYALCGSVFRGEFKKVFCCTKEDTLRRQTLMSTYNNHSVNHTKKINQNTVKTGLESTTNNISTITRL